MGLEDIALGILAEKAVNGGKPSGNVIQIPDLGVLDELQKHIEAGLEAVLKRTAVSWQAKGTPVKLFDRQPFNALSQAAVDCRGYNAVHFAVYANGTTPSVVFTAQGGEEVGGNYQTVPDPRGTRTITADVAFDVAVGSAYVKVDLSSISGTFGGNNQGFTVWATPYVAGGQADAVAGGHTVSPTQTPTITAGAYVANDAVGGLLTFSNAARRPSGTGIIHSLTIQDLANQRAELDLFLFDQTFTATANNDPFDPSDADWANCIGHIKVTASDYVQANDKAVATVRGISLPMVLSGSRHLYGQLCTRGTPTYASTADLRIFIGILQD